MVSIQAKYDVVLIGVSAGGHDILQLIFSNLPSDYRLPIVIAYHIPPYFDERYLIPLARKSNLPIKMAEHNEFIKNGWAYFAPPDRHLVFSLPKKVKWDNGPLVHYSRPSIDVLFKSAAHILRKKVVGIVLTGANYDGTDGLKAIKDCGGLTIIQDPKEAEFKAMPASAMRRVKIDHVLKINQIIRLLKT